MKVTGRGILRINGDDWLIVRPAFLDSPPDTLSKYDFYVSRRYFIEKPEEGILAGEDVFMEPHWKSLYGDVAFIIDWFPEPREFEITEKLEEE